MIPSIVQRLIRFAVDKRSETSDRWEEQSVPDDPATRTVFSQREAIGWFLYVTPAYYGAEGETIGQRKGCFRPSRGRPGRRIHRRPIFTTEWITVTTVRGARTRVESSSLRSSLRRINFSDWSIKNKLYRAVRSHMPTQIQQKRCHSCQFEAAAGDDEWERISHPSLGELTQCPECGSTDIRNIG